MTRARADISIRSIRMAIATTRVILADRRLLKKLEARYVFIRCLTKMKRNDQSQSRRIGIEREGTFVPSISRRNAETEPRKSEIECEIAWTTSRSHFVFFCLSFVLFFFFITIITSMFIPSFVINKNRYIVVWAAAWRQTNRQATNYSNNSSSSSNSSSNNW